MSSKLELSPILKNGLIKLEMFNSIPVSGLKFVENWKEESNYYVQMHLRDAKKFNAQAVYFRYFEDRPPLPQIYIYEKKERFSSTQKEINLLHKRLWSSCKVSMFFIFSKEKVEIYNNMDNQNINKKFHTDIEPLEKISLSETAKIQKEFRAKMFDTGEFWNTKYSKYFSYKHSAYDYLLDSLEQARERLLQNNKTMIDLVNTLLIKSMLLKYLEEKRVFEEGYWDKFRAGANSFREVCEDNQSLIDLFEDLSQHFNGGIFRLSDIEKKELKDADLTEFRFFLQPNIDNKKQLYFWDLYSFKDLPIELISNIYELFLKKEENKGVVYTPPILVDFLIDEMMPLSNKCPEEFKIIDPSCGSGIFLVNAYKRLIQWWQIKNEWKEPTVEILKSIMENNIYGLDLKGEAIEVAKFSLSLALCEILSPKVIWNDLRFDNLSDQGNLLHKDFFEVLDDPQYIKNFDLVIGNPPFVSELETEKTVMINKEAIDKGRPILPDNQVAYLFLEQSFKLLKDNAYLCMIQPSGFLYNNKTDKFREYFLKSFNCKQVLDFTGLNNSLFKSKGSDTNVATLVICSENKKPDVKNNEILHVTVRQTFESKEKIFFDLSYYDFHWMNYYEALHNKFVWKSNLVGGSRVVSIIKRLSKMAKLKEYLLEKKEKSGWVIGEGYQLNGKDKYKENHTADYITNKPSLPAEAFTEDGIIDEQIYIQNETNFHRPRKTNKSIFKPPHLLIKEKLGSNKIVCEYRDDYLTFRHDTIGIHAPIKEKRELQILEQNLKDNSLLYLFYLASSSAQAGVGRATVILKNDIDHLPYPTEKDSLELSKEESYFAEDTLNYMMDWIKGTTSKLPILNMSTEEQLDTYQKIYCELLNSVYKKFNHLKTISTDNYYVMAFYYKEKPIEFLSENELNDNDLETLISNKYNKHVHITRVIKIYDNKVIYIIKPKQLRFWLRSIAVRDADETVSDLITMRY